MPKPEKEQLVQELTEKMKHNNGVIVTQYQGMTVAELSELRAKLRAHKCEYTVVKNTLGSIALKNAGLESFAQFFEGPTAIAIENGDPVAPAKVILDFTKEHAKLKIKAGLMGTKMLSSDDVKALAALPSREVLLSRMLGSLQSPISGFVNVLQGTIRKFVYVLDAVQKSQSQKA
ncbi:MAG: 50S ribosomal protein L10 [Endomicrobiales bacterium]|jgi:large subunit ribosomal protein L10